MTAPGGGGLDRLASRYAAQAGAAQGWPRSVINRMVKIAAIVWGDASELTGSGVE